MLAALLAPAAQATRTRPPARTDQRRAHPNQYAVKARKSAATPRLPSVLAPAAKATRTKPPAPTNQRRAPRNQYAAKARRSAPTPKLQNVLALSPHHGPRRLKAAWW